MTLAEVDLDSFKLSSLCYQASNAARYIWYLALGAAFSFHDTPNFIIVNNDGSNAEIIRGAQPFAAFKALVDKKL